MPIIRPIRVRPMTSSLHSRADLFMCQLRTRDLIFSRYAPKRETRFSPWFACGRQADSRKSAAFNGIRRLFDNHAAIDVARTVFDFGAPGFWEQYIASGARPLTQPQSTAFRLSSQPSATLSQTTLRSTKNSKNSCSDTTVNCFRCSCIALGKRRHAEWQSRSS
jgi:hypothetical protein